MYKLLILLTLVFASGCASNGANPQAGVADNKPATTEEQVADARDSDKYEVICRRERTTGSRLSERVCKTRHQIEKEREESQERLRQEQGFRARKVISDNPASSGG